MSARRVLGVLQQEFFITRKSLEVMIDLPFFSIMSVVVFGFFSLYLSSSFSSTSAFYLLLGVLFWEVIRINQYSMSVSALWNVWSKNLSNMFISPLTITEYMAAQILSALFKSIVIFAVISLVCLWMFNFNILTIGWTNLVVYFLNLAVFSWSLGIAILGVIFRYGTRIQALAWGMIFLLQPLTAAFYPVEVLPPALQTIAWGFPSTYVFEGARFNLTDPSARWDLVMPASVLNVVYFVAAVLAFNWMFDTSRQTGQFVKNES